MGLPSRYFYLISLTFKYKTDIFSTNVTVSVRRNLNVCGCERKVRTSNPIYKISGNPDDAIYCGIIWCFRG
jgi:hypothetical protein